MHRFVFVWCLVGFFGSVAFATTDFSKAKWEFLSDESGVKTYRWKAPNSPVFAMRGVGVIDAAPEVVGSVLTDVEREPEWMPELKQSRIIKWISSVERVEFGHFRTPWIIKDREFLMHGKAKFIQDRNVIRLSFESVEDPGVPHNPKAVRAKMHSSFYEISSIEGGTKTLFEMNVHVDPMGKIAKWIVNYFQKGYPRGFIESVRKQAAKKDIKPLPQVKAVFTGKKNTLEIPGWRN